jgi:hypothetical protein
MAPWLWGNSQDFVSFALDCLIVCIVCIGLPDRCPRERPRTSIYSTSRSSAALASRSNFETARRSAIAALVYRPWIYRPLRSPEGAPARAPCIRHTALPLTAGPLQRLRLRFDIAVHRGDALASMRLISVFLCALRPSCLQIAGDDRNRNFWQERFPMPIPIVCR